MRAWRGWCLASVVVALVLTAMRGSPEAGGRGPTSRDLDLITTSASGNAARAKRLLVAGASVRAADARGVTALIAAAYGNHVHVARMLIEAGADVNVQDQTRQSAFLIATSEGYVELLRLALEAGADVRRTDSYDGTGLIRAAHHGHAEVVRELLRAKCPVDHVNRLGWTALLEAIVLGDGGPRHTETVRLLVEAGADVNLADGGGVTPLAHARQRGQTRIVEILERAGAK
ncbi:MAG: ankyrin repeat domain-containing protein [Candidatus Rokuibacteriota bacterium]